LEAVVTLEEMGFQALRLGLAQAAEEVLVDAVSERALAHLWFRR
jgi:methylmalonyl-CoA mutase cobalamin-binding subunit